MLGFLDAHYDDAAGTAGHAWLAEQRPGLGAYLHAALGGRVPVVGIAKREHRGAPALAVHRGQGARALWVSAVGIEAEVAAAQLAAMHGEHRLPTLLVRADHAARGLP